MVLKIPQKHNFPESLKEEIFDKTGLSLPDWEISVSRKDNLAWSIVLSYLMSTNYREKGDFAKRLTALTGSSGKADTVKRSIRRFNPFRNRWSCFFDGTLKIVVNNFKKNLDGWDKLNVFNKLSIASEALECPILLIKDYAKPENYRIFGKTVKEKQNFIVLIEFTFKDLDSSEVAATVYNFMISDTIGQSMQKAALHYYLNETDIPKKVINKLTNVIIKEDTFIKTILNSNYKSYILDVYKSPYVVSKLAEAGYEMDPRVNDSEGFSGLYYALALEGPEILYKLYYFAVDNCRQAEVSFRNPDPNIVSNLQCIEDLLSDNMSKLKNSNSHHQYSDMKIKFEELLRLNRFLIELNRKILEIKNRLNYYESTSDTVFEAVKRRDVVVSLLDIYEKFFKYEEKSPLYPLDDYIFHKNYYLSVDMVTAIIFFDNIYFLKERLELKEDEDLEKNVELRSQEDFKTEKELRSQEELKTDKELKSQDELQNDGKMEKDKKLEKSSKFSEIESSFFFSVLYNIVFEKMEHVKGIQGLEYFHLSAIYTFPLKYRIDNFDKLNNFRRILHDITINDSNAINHIPESEIDSIFHSHPIFKDDLELRRLRNCIKVCKKLRVIDIKSVLVIERVLQVIGECLAPEEKEFSFRRFLSLCLPKEIEQMLRRLRHTLTHLKGHTFPAKFECERNFSFFRSILSEIRRIERYFRPVYCIITLCSSEYLISKFKGEIRELLLSYSQPFVHTLLFSKTIILCDTFFSQYFQQHKPKCHDLFKTITENLHSEMENGSLFKKGNVVDARNKIIYLLWPVKWLLELLQRCGMANVEPLLNSLKKLKSRAIDSLSNLKVNTDAFIKECLDFLPQFEIDEKKSKTRTLKSVKHIAHFLEILKGCVYLSDEEKNEIRKEIPEDIKQQVSIKNQLIQSIEEGLYLEIDSADFELTYLSKKKMKKLRQAYENKDEHALIILKTQDPVEEIEEIFLKNSIDKKKYDCLCEVMEFSDETRKKLFRIVSGQRQKPTVNNLINLLNRIRFLKEIIIDEDELIQGLWLKIKRETSRQLIVEKIVRRYLKDFQFQTAIEMLLFDCMILFEGVKLPEKLWNKSSKLYQGINIRNIISHGHPLVENLCMTLDPQELPSEKVKKILILIKGIDAIEAILELYGHVDNDFTKVLEIINCDETNELCELRERITNCHEWKNYVLLLPDTRRNK